VAVRIPELTHREIRRTQRTLTVSKDRWLREVACSVFRDPRQFFDAQGAPIPINKLQPEAAAAISRFEVVLKYAGKGEDRHVVGYVEKYKVLDKIGALTIIGKHCGFLVDKPEHGGPDDEAIDIDAIRKDLTARIARLSES